MLTRDGCRRLLEMLRIILSCIYTSEVTRDGRLLTHAQKGTVACSVAVAAAAAVLAVSF